MRPPSKALSCLSLALALVGCLAPATTRGRVASRPPVGPAASLASAGPLAPGGATRQVGAEGVALSLSGRVQLLANHGGGLISNHGGGLISNHGGGLISNHSASYRLAQAEGAASLASSPLADAVVEVLDAKGQVLLDAQGQPISAPSGPDGSYRLAAKLPPEALVLRVRLWNGGELKALLTQDGGAQRQVDLSTPSSLGATYVLQRLVQGRAELLNKLPAAEATGLTQALETALQQQPLRQEPGHAPEQLLQLAEGLQQSSPPVAQRLERIRSLLLVGLQDLGNGRLATEVAISSPTDLVVDPDGGIFLLEGGGRVRYIDPQGRIRTHSGGGKGEGPSFQFPVGLVRLATGQLLVADALGNAVRLVEPNGDVRPHAGRGVAAAEPLASTAMASAVVRPTALAMGPDGALYVAELPKTDLFEGRLLRVGPEGGISTVALPAEWTGRRELSAVAWTPKGELWVVKANGPANTSSLQRRDASGQWHSVDEETFTGGACRLLASPDGWVYRSDDRGHRLWRYPEGGGPRELVAGTGQPGGAGDGGPAAEAQLQEPGGLALSTDAKTLFISDLGTGRVRALALDAPGRPMRTVAGLNSAGLQGDASTIAVSAPSGLALDHQGRLVFAETSSSTVKRLEGNQLSLVAGAGRGYGGDGGPAVLGKLDSPFGLAHHQGRLYITDTINERLRMVDEAGVITTLMGKAPAAPTSPDKLTPLASEVKLERPMGVAVDAQGRPLVLDNQKGRLYRLESDGRAHLVFGPVDGEMGEGPAGPAIGCRTRGPTGVAFGPNGALYIADAGNGVIWEVLGLDGPNPTTRPFLGLGLANSVPVMKDAQAIRQLRVPKEEAVLVSPLSLAFDHQGRMLIVEGGTDRLRTFLSLAGVPDPGFARLRPRIRRLEADGTLVSLVGDGTGVLDDVNQEALISPVAVVVDAQGRLIISDTGLNQVRLLRPDQFEPKP